jgi:tetratricopeptide (TPR) repeat protein
VRQRSSPFAERGGSRLGRATPARGFALVLALGFALGFTLALSGAGAPLAAQGLSPKRALTVGPAPGCQISANSAPIARRDNAEARRLATAGQEAALIGDQAAARDAFARAAVLNPGDERIAYDLGRAHEELADSTKAIGEFCRYLTLSPGGREAADVRDRLTRLVPRAAQQRAQDVQVAFKLGLALFDDGRYEASARAFDDVVRQAPSSAEGFFNRGLARAATGKRSDALKDLEQYRANAPTVDDRVEVGRAIEVLRRPVFSPGVAFTRGILPGFGQFYEAHPLRGVVFLVTAVGSAGFAFTQKTETRTINYVDPNGVPAPYTESTTSRPYFAPAIGAAVGVTIAGIIEAVVFANKSQQGSSIVVRRGAGGATSPGDFSLAPLFDRQGRTGLHFSARF